MNLAVSMKLMKLKYREVKEVRDRKLTEQGSICPLCNTEILEGEEALDHCHETGHVRMVLHRACNTAEGKILHWIRRSRGTDKVDFLHSLINYWQQDYTGNPEHPSHGRKRTRRKKRKT